MCFKVIGMPHFDKDFPEEPVIGGLGKLKQQDPGLEPDWALSSRERDRTIVPLRSTLQGLEETIKTTSSFS